MDFSLVAGLIGTVTPSKNGLMPNNGFIKRGRLTGDINFNDYTIDGEYSFSSLGNVTNAPDIDWGILIVFSPEDTGFVEQIAMGFNTCKMRMKGGLGVSNRWSNWKTIY